ncbi:hypothetical protein CspeluHIS016_0305220 [Cutaneotrichosporon spelunceum]|uniref:Probable RNA-binding protein 18 n=1 Tax=Cutaneotrichosporon spelunceum TaxID=1672016 RepID=A0AAD3TUC3_9TREE|nr:hypothetical protein CspeluHIS016_0305220 [Cutaneotrichosporon spelunceum]
MAASGKPDRLFVGNLAPSVDEYTLVQVFSKYGKISKLDLMVHHSGPQKGKPRGYAFVEYESKDDAVKALVKLHDRLLRGRKLAVTYANAVPVDDGQPFKRRVEIKPTSLSLLKARKPQSAEAQIAAMEAKLAALRNRPDRSPTPERVAADELEAEIRRELALEGGEAVPEGGKETHAPSPEVGSVLPASPSSPKPPGLAGLPPKPVAAVEALRPRRDRASPRRHDRYTPGRDEPRSRDRSPRRDESRYQDEPHRSPRRHERRDAPRDDSPHRDGDDRRRDHLVQSPRNLSRRQGHGRDRSPAKGARDSVPTAHNSAKAAERFQAGLAGLPNKPSF